MKTFLYFLAFIIYSVILVKGTWQIAMDHAESRRADDLEEYRRKKNELVKKYRDENESLSKKLTATQNGLIVKNTAYECLRKTYCDLSNKYRIIVSTSQGLHRTLVAQRNAYTKLSDEYRTRESEHQKELDDIHNYYKETRE